MDLTILFALALANLSAAAPTAASTVVIRVDSWGGSVSLGPSKSNIINAVTTIIPGAPPTSQNGELFLWPGMSNGTGDLVQTTIESWSGGNSWCGANSTQWCVRASLFGGFGQKDSEFNSPVNGDDHVRIEYNLESDGQTWEQNVTNALTGAFLSRFAYASGPYMTGYGTGTECDDSCTPTISDQKYLNTTITLKDVDPTFGKTITTGGKASYTNLHSSRDGKVWTIDEIHIPAMST